MTLSKMLKQSISLPLPIVEAQKSHPFRVGPSLTADYWVYPGKVTSHLRVMGLCRNFYQILLLKTDTEYSCGLKKKAIKRKNKLTEILHLTFFQKKRFNKFSVIRIRVTAEHPTTPNALLREVAPQYAVKGSRNFRHI